MPQIINLLFRDGNGIIYFQTIKVNDLILIIIFIYFIVYLPCNIEINLTHHFLVIVVSDLLVFRKLLRFLILLIQLIRKFLLLTSILLFQHVALYEKLLICEFNLLPIRAFWTQPIGWMNHRVLIYSIEVPKYLLLRHDNFNHFYWTWLKNILINNLFLFELLRHRDRNSIHPHCQIYVLFNRIVSWAAEWKHLIGNGIHFLLSLGYHTIVLIDDVWLLFDQAVVIEIFTFHFLFLLI